MFSCVQGGVDHTPTQAPGGNGVYNGGNIPGSSLMGMNLGSSNGGNAGSGSSSMSLSALNCTGNSAAQAAIANGGPLTAADRDILDRVLEEGIKLKRKCKSLRYLLLETENKRAEESRLHEKNIQHLTSQYEGALAELKGAHYIELAQTKEGVSSENGVLSQELRFYQAEHAKLQEAVASYPKRIKSLEREVSTLKAEAESRLVEAHMLWEREQSESVRKLCASFDEERATMNAKVAALEAACNELKTEKQAAIEAKNSIENLLAERQADGFSCQDCSRLRKTLDTEYKKGEDLKFELQSAKDETAYLNDENRRLEKQVTLILAELENLRENHSTVHPPSSGRVSEREHKLMAEIATARAQIVKLQEALDTVVAAKEAVEAAASSVLSENQTLSRELRESCSRLETLQESLGGRRPQSTVPASSLVGAMEQLEVTHSPAPVSSYFASPQRLSDHHSMHSYQTTRTKASPSGNASGTHKPSPVASLPVGSSTAPTLSNRTSQPNNSSVMAANAAAAAVAASSSSYLSYASGTSASSVASSIAATSVGGSISSASNGSPGPSTTYTLPGATHATPTQRKQMSPFSLAK